MKVDLVRFRRARREVWMQRNHLHILLSQKSELDEEVKEAENRLADLEEELRKETVRDYQDAQT